MDSRHSHDSVFRHSIAVRIFFVLPELERIEALADRKDIERVMLGMDLMHRQLTLMAEDIAVWDDTMEYFSTRQPDYLQSNFTADTLVNLGINLMVFADNAGQILWSMQVDFASEESRDADPELAELLVARGQNLIAAATGDLTGQARYADSPFPSLYQRVVFCIAISPDRLPASWLLRDTLMLRCSTK